MGELPDLERQRRDSPNQTTRIPTHLLPSFVTQPQVRQPTDHRQSLNLGEKQNYLNATFHSYQEAQRLLPAELTWPSAKRKTRLDTQEYLDSFFSHRVPQIPSTESESCRSLLRNRGRGGLTCKDKQEPKNPPSELSASLSASIIRLSWPIPTTIREGTRTFMDKPKNAAVVI